MPVLYKLMILICFSALPNSECTETNNHSVTKSDETYNTPWACLTSGEEMIANRDLTKSIREYDEKSGTTIERKVYARIVCAPAKDSI